MTVLKMLEFLGWVALQEIPKHESQFSTKISLNLGTFSKVSKILKKKKIVKNGPKFQEKSLKMGSSLVKMTLRNG